MRRLATASWRLGLVVLSLSWPAPPADAGPVCSSLVLNGTTAYATAGRTIYPSSSALTTFTVEAWFYPTAAPSTNTSKMIVTDDAYDVAYVNSNGNVGLRMAFYNTLGGSTSAERYGVVTLNQWTHVAVVYDVAAGQARMYVNGTLGTTLTVSLTGFGVFSNNFNVGAFSPTQSLFTGYIDDVRVSDVARYNSTFTPPDSLIADGSTRALYAFSESSSATSFADASANGYALTAGGGAVAGNSPTTNCGPVISPQPRSQSLTPGDAAVLYVQTLGPTASTFQWYVGAAGDTSSPIAGATGSSYITPALTATAQYWVNVTNPYGSIASSTASITVVTAGANFTVNSTLDVVEASPGDGNCATAGGVCTLRAAIQEARSLTGTSHVITLPAGTFTITIAGRTETLSATGDFNPSGYIRINGASAATTIIDGGGLDRIFRVTSGGLTLADLTLQNGNPGGDSGGCISTTGVNLTIERVTVKSCTTTASGGGIAMVGTAATLRLTDSVVRDSTGFNGGGLYLAAVTTVIRRTTVSGNAASIDGGGVYLNGPALLNASASTFSQNTAVFYGGSIYLFDSGVSAVVTGSIANTTISGNTTTSFAGGALYFSGSSGSVELTNDTIASNSSASTGAVVANGAVQWRVRNTIISGSTGSASSNCAVTGGQIVDLGNNLEYPGTACGFSLASDIRADPLLGALTDNGGLTQTRAPGAGSPALNAGDDATCLAAPVSGADQRGVGRPKGARCDIGAYEATVPFTDDPLTAGSTAIRAVHLTELRTRIDAVRVTRQLSGYAWTGVTVTAGSTLIQAAHITELREALRQAYVAAGLTPPTYTDPGLAAGTAVKAVHIAELRAAVIAIE